MDDLVTIEHRGVLGTLNVGDFVQVESLEAGVLKLRRVPAELGVSAAAADAPADAPIASPTDEAPK